MDCGVAVWLKTKMSEQERSDRENNWVAFNFCLSKKNLLGIMGESRGG